VSRRGSARLRPRKSPFGRPLPSSPSDIATVEKGIGGLATPATASTIEWVGWTDTGGTGPYTVSGSAPTSGLTVAASYTAKAANGWQEDTGIAITDSSWTFTPNTMTAWNIYQSGSNYAATGTFDFTNTGGLAAGGSLGILDVEDLTSTIGVKGYQWNGSSYDEVTVNWSYSYYTIQSTATAPVWNGTTNVLTGGGERVGGYSMFSMLTSDVRLDRIVLDMNLNTGDGFGIGFTQTNIAAGAVPGAGLAGLATIGLAGVSRRRRR